jgi:O-antigen/teichoic acid export membrane protein
MLAQLIASGAVFLVGGRWVLAALPEQARGQPPAWDGWAWLRQSVPFLAIAGSSAVSRQVSLLTLGAMGTAADAGIYAAMMRISEFSLMGTYAVSSIASPMIVELTKNNNHPALRQVTIWGTRATFAFALAAAGGIAFFGDWILAAFGKGFMGGKDVLYILLAGQLIWAFAGLTGYLLAMTGHADVVATIGWISAACNLLTCLVLVPNHGAIGAAWGTGIAWAVQGMLGLYFCWRYHNLWMGLR